MDFEILKDLRDEEELKFFLKSKGINLSSNEIKN